MKMFRTIKCGVLAAFLLLGIAAPLTFTSCENEHPEINIELKSDYSGIITAVNDVNKALADKLATIEAAIKNGTLENTKALDQIKAALNSMTGTLADKLAAIEAAVKDQTTSLETKLALIEVALNEGFASVEEAQDLMTEALGSLEGTLEDKLAAIEDAVADQTLSLETKLDLINTAVTEGFASLAEGQDMIVEALNAIDGTIDEKMDALEKAIKAQTTTLSAKLAAIEAAVKAGFADEVKALGLVKDAIKAMDGTLKNKLDALKEAINDQTTELSTKLEAIEAAVEEGFINEVEALGFIEDAIEAMDGNLQAKLNAVVAAIKAQTLSLETKLALIETALNDGFATEEQALGLIQTAVETMDGNLQTKLNAVVAAIRAQTTSLETKLELIEAAINNGFTTEEQALGLIEEAINALPDYTDVLGELKDVIEAQTTELSTKLNAVVAAIRTGFANEAQALGLIQEAIEAIEIPDYADVLGDIKDALTNINYNLSGNGSIATSLAGLDETLAEIADLVAAQDYTEAFATLAEALADIQEALGDINETLDARLAQIRKVILDGFANVEEAIGTVMEDLIEALPDYSEVLGNIQSTLTNLNYNLSSNGPIVSQLTAIADALGEDGVLADIVDALGEDGIEGVLLDILDQLGEIGSQDYSEYFEDIVEALGALNTIAEAFGEDGAIDQLVDALEGIEEELGENGAIAGQLAELIEGITGDGGTNDILQAIADALADEDSGLPAIVDALGDNSEALQQIVEALMGDPDDPDNNGLLGVIEELKDILDDQGDTLDEIVETLEELIELIQDMIPEKVYEYIELAPNFTWCTMNVGADKVTESGDYFAWAETVPKDLYSPDNYIWGDDQDRYPRGEQNYPLLSEDDAATVNWGAKYRTPTRAEWEALRNTDNFTWTYVESYKGSGVEGYTVTSKVSGYEGKMIFLPLTGYYDEDGFHNDSWMGNNYSAPFKAGTYWSASGSAWGSNARRKMAVSNIVWHDGDEHPYMMGPDKNYRGYVVRAVYDAGEFELPGDPVAPEPETEINGFEFVNMGHDLVWATANVGAETPEEFGGYFAWGELSPKSAYHASNYRFVSIPSTETEPEANAKYYFTKYTLDDGVTDGLWYNASGVFQGDGKTTLDIADDAAHANMGGTWRIPTKAEWDVLLNTEEYTWEWITTEATYSYGNVQGWKVTCNIEGDCFGNTLFFPATGWAMAAADPAQYAVPGWYGYWSSDMNYEPDNMNGNHFGTVWAWCGLANLGTGGSNTTPHGEGTMRSRGYSIRAVAPAPTE